MMFTSGFAPSHNPKKGYQTTHANWVNYKKTESSLLHGVSIDVYENYGAVSEQLWESVHNVITFSSHMMHPFLAAMGVKTEDMSPFCRNSTSIEDLCNNFIRYCPNTFTYEGIVVGGIPDPTVNLKADGRDVITSDHVADNICCIVSDLLASGSDLDDGKEDSDGDGDSVGIDLDTVPPTEPSSSNAQLTSNSPT